MMKVCFPTLVKHNGVKYPANVPFEVKNEEVAELRKLGAWVVQEPKTTEEPTPVPAKKKAGGAKAKEVK